MRDSGSPTRVELRICESKMLLSPAERRAELLKRNPRFRRELFRGPIKRHWLIDNPKLQGILYRWGISSGWDGKWSTLDQYVYLGPSIMFRNSAAGQQGMILTGRTEGQGKTRGPSFIWKKKDTTTRSGKVLEEGKEYPIAGIPASVVEEWIKTGAATRGAGRPKVLASPRWAPEIMGQGWSREIEKECAYIYVRIAPATNGSQFRDLWSEIEKLKKSIFYSERSPRTFDRDLCFWDLHHLRAYGKKSWEWIHDHWPGKEWSETVIRHGDERIQEYIDRLSPVKR